MSGLYWSEVEGQVTRTDGGSIMLDVTCECNQHVKCVEGQYTACAACGRVYHPVVAITTLVAGPPQDAPEQG